MLLWPNDCLSFSFYLFCLSERLLILPYLIWVFMLPHRYFNGWCCWFHYVGFLPLLFLLRCCHLQSFVFLSLFSSFFLTFSCVCWSSSCDLARVYRWLWSSWNHDASAEGDSFHCNSTLRTGRSHTIFRIGEDFWSSHFSWWWRSPLGPLFGDAGTKICHSECHKSHNKAWCRLWSSWGVDSFRRSNPSQDTMKKGYSSSLLEAKRHICFPLRFSWKFQWAGSASYPSWYCYC